MEGIPALVEAMKECAAGIRATMEAFAAHMGTSVEELRARPEHERAEINRRYHAWRAA